jgi:hypothetical protein
MAKFRKKPVVIEAVQLRWDTWSEMCDFLDVGHLAEGKPEGCYLDDEGVPGDGHRLGIQIPTLEGVMIGSENDWIIKGIQGEFYPCKPDIFEATYESVE